MVLDTLYFPAGLAIGLGAAAPVGPVNLLVIQRTLCRHIGSGLMIGLAAACGDALFALVAAFGLGVVESYVHAHAGPIRVAGGLVMLGFALVTWRSAPHLNGRDKALSGWRAAILCLSMTLTNPATLLFFLGAFGAVAFVDIGHGSTSALGHAALVVAGVFCGSMLWWLIVTSIAARLRRRIGDPVLVAINHGTAVALAVFGVAAIGTGLA